MIVQVPVSIGECVDKLTILDIKRACIKDPIKRVDVHNEFTMLYNIVSQYFSNENFKYHYSILKAINMKIWDDMDSIRTIDRNTQQTEWVEACYATVLDNDRRFRVKYKINALLNSSLKEQKGYAMRKAFLLTHLGLGDMITANGMVRYLSTSYDEVTVVCRRQYAENMKLIYGDDPTIKLLEVSDDKEISPVSGGPSVISKFQTLTEGSTVFFTGDHTANAGTLPYNFDYIPFSFYCDAGLGPTVYWDYFHCATHVESESLYSSVKERSYIILHSSTSRGGGFTTKQIQDRFGYSPDTTLYLDLTTNVYQPGHAFYELAQQFVNKPIAFYKDTIIHASAVLVMDSSIFCFAMQLPIQTSECYIMSRDGKDYSYIWNSDFGYDASRGQRIFKPLVF